MALVNPPNPRIHVGNIDLNSTNKRDLEGIFRRYGALVDFKCFETYAFVQFETVDQAKEAIQYENGRDLGGKRMVVSFAKLAGPRGRSQPDYDSRRATRSPSPESSSSYHHEGGSHKRERSGGDFPDSSPQLKRGSGSSKSGFVVIYALHTSLRSYAEYVQDVFRKYGIDSNVEYVDGKGRLMAQVDRATRHGIRFTCLIRKEHEDDGDTVSFRAVDQNGNLIGLGDTLLSDVIQYVLVEASAIQSATSSSAGSVGASIPSAGMSLPMSAPLPGGAALPPNWLSLLQLQSMAAGGNPSLPMPFGRGMAPSSAMPQGAAPSASSAGAPSLSFPSGSSPFFPQGVPMSGGMMPSSSMSSSSAPSTSSSASSASAGYPPSSSGSHPDSSFSSILASALLSNGISSQLAQTLLAAAASNPSANTSMPPPSYTPQPLPSGSAATTSSGSSSASEWMAALAQLSKMQNAPAPPSGFAPPAGGGQAGLLSSYNQSAGASPFPPRANASNGMPMSAAPSSNSALMDFLSQYGASVMRNGGAAPAGGLPSGMGGPSMHSSLSGGAPPAPPMSGSSLSQSILALLQKGAGQGSRT